MTTLTTDSCCTCTCNYILYELRHSGWSFTQRKNSVIFRLDVLTDNSLLPCCLKNSRDSHIPLFYNTKYNVLLKYSNTDNVVAQHAQVKPKTTHVLNKVLNFSVCLFLNNHSERKHILSCNLVIIASFAYLKSCFRTFLFITHLQYIYTEAFMLYKHMICGCGLFSSKLM